MDRVIGQVEKERFRLVAIDKGNRFLGQAVGQVTFVVDPLLVAIDRVTEFGFAVAAQVKVTVTPATHKLVALVKSAIHRVPFQFGIVGIETQVPFADRRRYIFVRQIGRKYFLVGIKTPAAIAGRIDTGALRVTAQHDACPGGRADMPTGIGL